MAMLPPKVPPPERLPMVSLALTFKTVEVALAMTTAPVSAMALPLLRVRVPALIVVAPV